MPSNGINPQPDGVQGRGTGRQPPKCWLWAGAAAVVAANGLHAAGLFLPAGPASDVAPVAKAAPARRSAAAVPDAWERRVRVARHELAAARADVETAGAGRLLLNVRDGVRLDVAVERTAPTMFGYSLSGRVVGGGGAGGGFVTLVVHDEAVAGSIWTPDSAYELSYLGGGVHALRDVTNAPPVECPARCLRSCRRQRRPQKTVPTTVPWWTSWWSGRQRGKRRPGASGQCCPVSTVWWPTPTTPSSAAASWCP